MTNYLGLIGGHETVMKPESPGEISELCEISPITCSTCGAELIPTIAAYVDRCTVHMTEAEFMGWLHFHHDHWREYYDPKTGERR